MGLMLNDPSLVRVVLCGPSRLKATRAVLAASSASKHLGPVLRNLRLVEAAVEVTGLEGLGSAGSAWESWYRVQLWNFTSFILREGFVLSVLLLGRTSQEGARTTCSRGRRASRVPRRWEWEDCGPPTPHRGQNWAPTLDGDFVIRGAFPAVST